MSFHNKMTLFDSLYDKLVAVTLIGHVTRTQASMNCSELISATSCIFTTDTAVVKEVSAILEP